MISICYETPTDFGFKDFPNTAKGNREALKLITDLHEERKKHVWYFNLPKIKTVKDKLDNKKLGTRTKKRYQLESELRTLTEERNKVLKEAGVTEAPKTITISISQI